MASSRAASSNAAAAPSAPLSRPPEPSIVIVGKDVLELLSSAMYVDPLSIYREYVQNAADSIEDARRSGLLGETQGFVEIAIDSGRRSALIRDNGAGIPVAEAARRLLAIGASIKRGTRARGFRGVGRLAGLAYARSLTFRTRARGDNEVAEIRWDCQRLKTALRDVDQDDDVASVMQRVVTVTHLCGNDWPEHFFEVELNDVIRTKRDCLLNPALVRDYLEQVAPVPFGSSFSFREQIAAHLATVSMGSLDIRINDDPKSISRPFRDRFQVSSTQNDVLSELELITLPDLDGGIAAVGWLVHHSYLGSITVQARVGGLRARVGNIQVGGDDLFADVFPEARFNGWTVGEIHILDPRILPNARRDHFEQNIHYSNLTAQLEPLARRIARRARTASIERNQARTPAIDASSRDAVIKEARQNSMPSTPASSASPQSITTKDIRLSTLDQVQRDFLVQINSLANQFQLSATHVREAIQHLLREL